jgi:hypothetical protein
MEVCRKRTHVRIRSKIVIPPLMSTSYEQDYRRSLEQPELFWSEQAKAIEWFARPEKIMEKDANGVVRWFGGGKLNTAWLALDRHVEAGRGDQIALIYDSPVTIQSQPSRIQLAAPEPSNDPVRILFHDFFGPGKPLNCLRLFRPK